jgi:hypothetical protein
MFPIDFAFQVVREYCPEGGSVFDPFAGRGSSIYAAAAQKRRGLGIELNPVGWLYSKVKLRPASEGAVLRRLKELEQLTCSPTHLCNIEQYARSLPEFFRFCYSQRVLYFLVAARQNLRWQSSQVDATLMAILLVYLHAKAGSGLSNQMRQSKAMSPPYAIRWWREHGKEPPDIDPVQWLKERIEWRYAKGLPRLHRAGVWLGDSTMRISQVTRCISRGDTQQFNLLFTSPPYFAVTNYQYDQWLRLWMLGNPPQPVAAAERSRGRFESKAAYQQLLLSVFSKSAPLLRENAVIYVRTDAREFTRTTTESVLRAIFPDKYVEVQERPYSKTTQTSLFGDSSAKPGDVDIILLPRTTV